MHEHTRVPAKYKDEDGVTLGSFVHNVRTDYRTGRLTKARIEAIEELPGWTWDQLKADWDAAFQLLTDFEKREGNTRVPFEFVEDGFRLGNWASTQRVFYRRGDLPTEQQRQLESLASWSWGLREKKGTSALHCCSGFASEKGTAGFHWATRKMASRLGRG